MKTLSVLTLAAALAVSATAAQAASDRPVPLPDQKATVAHSLQPCPGGLERFLPGDYYFCSAAQDYWSGHMGLARENLKDAARWASKPAQYALGVMYFNGDHADRNRPLGLAWLALAAERHDPAYEPTFISAYQHVTPEELAQADAYWNDLKATYADRVAAPRAEHQFDRAYREIEWAVNFGGSVFIDGVVMPASSVASSDNLPLQSGFTVGRLLQSQKAMYFYGYDSHVFVGDAVLVPVSQVNPRKTD
jgi:TPR repeat protein